MSSWSNANDELLCQALEDALQALEGVIEEAIRAEVSRIVMRNFEHKRIQRVLVYMDITPPDYVDLVVRVYHTQCAYVEQVMAGSSTVWLDLYENMQHWAFHFLLRNNFYPTAETFELAVSYAGDAGVTLIHADYPYDVNSFEAWAVELVKNVCRKNIKKAVAQHQIPEAKLSPLDEFYSDSDILRALEQFVEQKHDLTLVMADLTDRERFVITGIFNGLDTNEIATQLDISHSQVYKLKNIAIKKLRGKISGE